MSSSTGNFRPSVTAARKIWSEGCEAIRKRHDSGTTGLKTVTDFSDLLDKVLLGLHHAIVKEKPEYTDRLSLVLHGGCGRREVAPFSAVDFMLLYQSELTKEVEGFARQYIQDVNDSGLDLGFSLRTPREAVSLALQEPEIFTSLTESRLLGGNEDIFESYFSRLKRLTRRRSRLRRRVNRFSRLK